MKKGLTKKLSFSVVGAGNGGQGLAAYLAYKGYDVNLYNRSMKKILNIKKRGYIDLEGNIIGRGHLKLVTNNIEKAIKDVDIIMVVLPACAHKSIANKIAPFLTSEQYIVLNPGRTGGALEFKSIIERYNPMKEVCIIEAQTFLFACRLLEEGRVKILQKKQEIKVAALPSKRTYEFIEKIHKILPEFTSVNSVLETSFNNIGAVLHPIPTILNCGRIESTLGDFNYYIDGITPAVAKIVEQADYERMMVATKLGVKTISLKEWLAYTYDAHGDTLCESLRNTECYWEIKAPATVNTRYIFEDVPQSLVPISDMGRYLGINTPTIDSMIHIASILHDIDYYKKGRKVVDMGIEGLTLEEIKSYVQYGRAIDLEGAVV
ncbi:MAG: NADP transhydrogenase subunit alpha [Alkaliphilus sp.]|nr:NAD/NADP octopine/nopaline dehydrogenase family protein [Alkaliphilus sp. AH-315-G20]PHS36562.1 MAG: NADP transhydrogenase subunit alpha [Alkaliphilus sp.]